MFKTSAVLDVKLDYQLLSSYFLKILTKYFQFSRLVTRTKESNIYASIKVIKTLMQNESKGRFDLLRWEEINSINFKHHRPIWIFFERFE